MTNNDRTVSALVVLSSVGACTTITLSQALVEDRKHTFESYIRAISHPPIPAESRLRFNSSVENSLS